MNLELMKDHIETKRLVLFPYTKESLSLFNSDLSRFEERYGVRYCGEELDHLLNSFLVKLEKEIEDDPENYLYFTEFLIVLKENDHIIGSIDFKYIPRDGITEIGYGMNRDYEGHGYMSEALEAFLKLGKKLGISKVLADTLPDNIRSQNVLKRNGFRFLKQDGNLWWEKDLRDYYEAYDDRYKTIHQMGYMWSSDESTPMVKDVIERYGITKEDKILEIGCGEGRDAGLLLKEGYDLLATDISKEAIAFCQKRFVEYSQNFSVLDCLKGHLDERYRMIYAVAVVHMLTEGEDRRKFYRFIFDHLEDGGIVLICSMGDGTFEMKSDKDEAFEIRERDHVSGKVNVTATSCRMVSMETFEKELKENGLKIRESGITSSLPDFDSLIYAVAEREK